GIIQAMSACKEGSVPDICSRHILLNEKKRASPDKKNVSLYKEIYQRYLNLRRELYKNSQRFVFWSHIDI
ncbi:MAG: hypothetical protein LBO80_02605, partial [Treponema sp.]|nr:hypothetical protein [Treponema sp.]